MSKQSSIDWLYNKMYEHRGNITIEEYEQAKAMHKEEMEHFFKRGMFLVEGRLWKPIDKFEENYKETYGGNNEME